LKDHLLASTLMIVKLTKKCKFVG